MEESFQSVNQFEDTSDERKEFIHWLTENGAIFPKIKFIEDGTFSNELINEYETFVTIPFSLTINVKIAHKTLPYLKNLSSCCSSLIVLLIHEKLLEKKSFYFPYINILPKHVNLLFYYNETEINHWLKGTNIENSVIKKKSQLKKDYEKILEVLPSDGMLKEKMSWELYLWAYSMITSRSFPNELIDPDDTESKEVLIPLADSLNHKPRQRITWQFSDGKSMQMIAGETIECGKEIFNNYGPKSNKELLLAYGFCIKDNPDDWIIIKVNFDQDPDREEKLEILKNSELLELTHYIKKNYIPNKLLSQCRILVLNCLEIIYFQRYYQEGKLSEGDLFDFVGYRNEISMLEIFMMLLNKKLNAIIIDEEEINQGAEMPVHVKIFRDGQKEILESAIARIQSLELKVLSCALDDFKANRISKSPFLLFKKNSTVNEFNSEILFSKVDKDYLEIKEALLDTLLITVDKAMKMDQAFSEAIHSIFDDELLESEEDTILILYLIHESNNILSYWKNFFEAVKDFEVISMQDETKIQELSEIHENLLQLVISNGLSNKLFSKEIFTLEKFIWASDLLESFYISLTNKEGKKFMGIIPL